MTTARKYKNWIAGQWKESSSTTPITNPYSGAVVAENILATKEQLDLALDSTQKAFSIFKGSSRAIRSKLLGEMAQQIENHRAKFVTLLMEECGKPKIFSDIEVTRAVGTFTIASEE